MHARPSRAPAGQQPPPPLEKIPDGQPGAGQYLLPVENTVTPVDADLINNIQRRPFRERFSILLNELGTGLAARGEDIQELVRRANPALQGVRRVPEDPRRPEQDAAAT